MKKSMKTLFLLPPSEGKKSGGVLGSEKISYIFQKPKKIALNATEKDLKCKEKRFAEAEALNKKIFLEENELLAAIERYSGVMYKAIGYDTLSEKGKQFFDENVAIFSGMYGILKPQDQIGNYKLPVEAKGLYQFWWDTLPERLAETEAEYIVNLLPKSYGKLLGLGTDCNRYKKKLQPILEAGKKIINIHFLTEKNEKIVSLAHGSKKIKGEFIRQICEKGFSDYKEFGGEIKTQGSLIDVNLYHNNAQKN